MSFVEGSFLRSYLISHVIPFSPSSPFSPFTNQVSMTMASRNPPPFSSAPSCPSLKATISSLSRSRGRARRLCSPWASCSAWTPPRMTLRYVLIYLFVSLSYEIGMPRRHWRKASKRTTKLFLLIKARHQNALVLSLTRELVGQTRTVLLSLGDCIIVQWHARASAASSNQTKQTFFAYFFSKTHTYTHTGARSLPYARTRRADPEGPPVPRRLHERAMPRLHRREEHRRGYPALGLRGASRLWDPRARF